MRAKACFSGYPIVAVDDIRRSVYEHEVARRVSLIETSSREEEITRHETDFLFSCCHSGGSLRPTCSLLLYSWHTSSLLCGRVWYRQSSYSPRCSDVDSP